MTENEDDIQPEPIFLKAIQAGCSDVHLKPGSPPKMRKNGILQAIPGYEGMVLTDRQTEVLAFRTMGTHNHGTYSANKYNHDYAYDLPSTGHRFRMNVYKTRGVDALVGRLLQDQPKTFKDLGIPTAVSKLAANKSGIVIISGATGSGKSTTMAAMIDFINKSRPVNIISIEDPIEIIHRDAKASISQREVGSDTESFGDALRAALREDPDVILIGEIRDTETLKTVLHAAETGHLVVTTLHTTDTSEVFNRILTMYPAEERDSIRRALAGSLKGVVGQRLVPAVNGGRIAVNEILINTNEISEIILDPTKSNRDIKNVIERKTRGMQLFEQHFLQLIEEGKITLNTAKENSIDPTYYDDPRFTTLEVKKDSLVVPHLSTPKEMPKIEIPRPLPQAPSKLLSDTLTNGADKENSIPSFPSPKVPPKTVRRTKNNPLD